MATDDFERACKEAARDLRRLPTELRKQLGARVRDEVAEPLAAQIRTAYVGPWATVLAAGTKVRVSGDPKVVVGGARPVVSGGASVRQLVYGEEFGGGKRVRALSGNSRRKGHRRNTTRQFANRGTHRIFGTIENTLDQTFSRWVDVVDDIVRKGVGRG